MNRGDIYWVSLDPTTGSEIKKRRPCVIVSADPFNKARRTVIVVPLSSSASIRPPITIKLPCLGRQAAAVLDQLRAVDKSRLTEFIEKLDKIHLRDIDESLKQVLAV